MPLRKVVISGGGTGGHIFPAIAIANAIKRKHPECEILFVGASGKMEMEKVPAAGYEIVGLDISGLKRKLTFQNFKVIYQYLTSTRKAKKILKDFQPDVAIGVGGYASAPTLKAATELGIKTVLQEQNSFAGITNKMLGKRANKICVAYENMEQFFPKDRIEITGNPVRSEMVSTGGKREEAYKYFELDPSKKTLLVLGGSLGARTINNNIKEGINKLTEKGVQIIWQCGKIYKKEMKAYLKVYPDSAVKLYPFIQRMDYAYAAADIIVSRAGAISVSEICMVGKAAVFVPSPNVAEDHQTKNAQALADNNAAVLVKDNEANEVLITSLLNLLEDEGRRNELASNIRKMARPNATGDILKIIEAVANR